MTSPIIVGIIGVAGSGKTLAARHLVEHYGFARTRFAEPIKRMLRFGFGLTDAQIDGAEKMTPIDDLGGCTPRHLMQTLGTEWGRRTVHSDLWINQWRRSVAALRQPVVVDDVRFPNEAAAVKALGGVLWRVYRPGLNSMDHASERLQRTIAEDALLTNATTVADMCLSVDALMARLQQAA